MYIAHVNIDKINDFTITFHLNIPVNSKIPRIGEVVFASADNGYHGHPYRITEVLDIMRFHKDKLTSAFVSVDYKAALIIR